MKSEIFIGKMGFTPKNPHASSGSAMTGKGFFRQKKDYNYHGNLRVPPQCHVYPGNKALIRPY